MPKTRPAYSPGPVREVTHSRSCRDVRNLCPATPARRARWSDPPWSAHEFPYSRDALWIEVSALTEERQQSCRESIWLLFGEIVAALGNHDAAHVLGQLRRACGKDVLEAE